MMRFIHAADIHLGAQPEKGFSWAAERGDEIWETFERLLSVTGREEVDFLLIAGDLFHRQPLLRELKEVNYLFSAVPDVRIVLIAGNHDYIKRDSYYRDFSWSSNVSMLTASEMGKIDFPDKNVCIYGASYHEREDRRRLYDGLHPQDAQRLNILLVHGGDEKHRPYDPKQLEESGFDYVAAGHIHKPQIQAGKRVVQAGCLEPLDVNETGERGYFLGEITGEYRNIQFVSFAKRCYRHEHIEVTPADTMFSVQKKIRDRIEQLGQMHMYRIELSGKRDDAIQFSKEQLLRIGNICKIEDNTRPDYPIERMYIENRDNILGMYIKEFLEKPMLSPEEEKALHYGIHALIAGEP